MRSRRISHLIVLPAALVLAGCGYVHVGKLPAPVTTVIGDEQLMQQKAALEEEKKLLQRELALARAQSTALEMALQNRASDGGVSMQLVNRLNETTRELTALRSSYAQLQNERDRGAATAAEAAGLKARLGETEERLAASLRNFTELQGEVVRLRGDAARVRDENLALTQQVRELTAQNEQAQAALAQLNTELLAQKEARFTAEQDAAVLRTELKNVAPNSSVLAQQRTGTAPEARTLVAEHAAETGALKREVEALRTRIERLAGERTQLQQQLARVEGPAADLANLEARLASTVRENEALKAAGGQLAAEKSELENQLARLRASPALTQAQALREQLREAQTRAAALTDENAQLRARIGKAEPAGPETGSIQAGRANPPAPAPARTAVVAPTVVSETPKIDLGSDSKPAPEAPQGVGVNATFVTNLSGGARNPAVNRIEQNGQRVHIVAGGDTLAKISTMYYGTPSRWADILAANRDVLGESNNLVIGRTLRIP